MIILMENHRPTCSVPGCTSPVRSRTTDLCIMHHARMLRHGSTDDPRPTNYGEKSAHPMWMRWVQLKKRAVLCDAWLDFWTFVEGVSPQPENTKKLARVRSSEPYGPGNFIWQRTPTREDEVAYLKAWRAARPNYDRERHLAKRYDISDDEYNQMLADQGGRCMICGSVGNIRNNQGDEKRLAVDHDHETNQVRDLLCDHCNRGIGCFEDNPALVSEALAYLLRHKPAKKVWEYPRERKDAG